jgi:hypothetical protein
MYRKLETNYNMTNNYFSNDTIVEKEPKICKATTAKGKPCVNKGKDIYYGYCGVHKYTKVHLTNNHCSNNCIKPKICKATTAKGKPCGNKANEMYDGYCGVHKKKERTSPDNSACGETCLAVIASGKRIGQRCRYIAKIFGYCRVHKNRKKVDILTKKKEEETPEEKKEDETSEEMEKTIRKLSFQLKSVQNETTKNNILSQIYMYKEMKKNRESIECTICYVDIGIKTICNHVICMKCMSKIIKCPFCRRNI